MPILNMVWWGTKWGNIWEPLNLTVTSSWLDATITWEDNEIWTIPPTSFQKSELVRKVGSAPTSPSDWTLVVTETVKDTYKVSGYVDSWLTDWTTYYYRVFSYSDLWGISYCNAVSVTASAWGWDFSKWTLSQTSSWLSSIYWGWVAFNNDGTKIFLSQYWNWWRVWECDLSTPYDVTTIWSFTKYISTQYPEDLFISPDGTKLFVLVSDWPQELDRYTLSTPRDISTATKDQYITTSLPRERWLYLTPDGLNVYISSVKYSADEHPDLLHATLSTAWDLSTISSFTTLSTSMWGVSIRFGDDWTYYFNHIDSESVIHYYELSTPYDINSVSTSGTLSVPSGDSAGWMWFDKYGRFCVIVWGAWWTNYVRKYTLS